MALKVIGSGLGRTGTYSLKVALEQLGYGKCYHMAELFEHPEGLIHFEEAEGGQQTDWEKLFDGYSSAVDYPVARYYKQLMVYYPEAKIIHTTRNAEDWFNSASKTIFWASKPSLFRILKMLIKLPFYRELRRQMPILRFNGRLIYLEFGKDCTNKEVVIARFNKHNEEVLNYVPKDKLLVFNAKEGWAPLCNFLGVPIPDFPFPKTNSTEEFIGRIKNFKKKIEIRNP